MHGRHKFSMGQMYRECVWSSFAVNQNKWSTWNDNIMLQTSVSRTCINHFPKVSLAWLEREIVLVSAIPMYSKMAASIQTCTRYRGVLQKSHGSYKESISTFLIMLVSCLSKLFGFVTLYMWGLQHTLRAYEISGFSLGSSFKISDTVETLIKGTLKKKKKWLAGPWKCQS